MARIIFHIDVNSAFLSWSAVKILRKNPRALDIRKVPSVVSGDENTRHGVITAASIPAKKRGIKTAQALSIAKRICPTLVVVNPDFATYKKYSSEFIAILKKYSPTVEQVSIDEAFMDMSGTEILYENIEGIDLPFPVNVAQKIKDEIKNTLGFTVNVGISSNKLLAKTASDFTKPDKIHTLWPNEIESKFWPLKIRDLYGCGKKTTEKLQEIGVYTIQDASKIPLERLISLLGNKHGEYIYNTSKGIDNSIVDPSFKPAKSYSNAVTMENDISEENFKDIYPIVQKLSTMVSKRLIQDSVKIHTITVTVKTNDFTSTSKQTTIDVETDSTKLIYNEAIKLLKAIVYSGGLFSQGKSIRLIGVGVSNIHKESAQLNLFRMIEEREKKNESSEIDKIRLLLNKKFGPGKVKTAKELKTEQEN